MNETAVVPSDLPTVVPYSRLLLAGGQKLLSVSAAIPSEEDLHPSEDRLTLWNFSYS